MAREKLSTEKRREQIAEAALEIAAAHGVKEVTVSNVAKKLELAPSALYRHYKGKDQMIDAVVERLGTHLVLIVEDSAAEAENVFDILEGILSRIIGLGHKLPAIPMVLFSEEIFHRQGEDRSKFTSILEQYLQKLTAIVAEGQESGLITREINADQLSIMFVGLYVPPMLLYYSSGGKFDLEGQIMSAWKLFQKTISPDHS